jgi:hypothetical protein
VDTPVKRSTAEIAAAIAKLFSKTPPAKKTLRAEWNEAEVPGRICQNLEAWKCTMRATFDREAVRQDRDRARNVIERIDELERALVTGPRDLKIDFSTKDVHPDSHPGRLFAELAHVRERCEAIEAETLAAGRKDQVKQSCAETALFMIQVFSTEEPSSNSAKTPFREITGLIFEALTGEPARDLERACDEAIKSWKPWDNSQPK